jgi:hypothetical protein
MIETRVCDISQRIIPPHLRFIVVTTTTLKEHLITSKDLMLSKGLIQQQQQQQQPPQEQPHPSPLTEELWDKFNLSVNPRRKKTNTPLRMTRIVKDVRLPAPKTDIYQHVDHNPKAVGLHRILMDLQSGNFLPSDRNYVFYENLRTLIAQNPSRFQFIDWISNWTKGGNTISHTVWFDLIPLDAVLSRIQTNIASLVQPVKGPRLIYVNAADLLDLNSLTPDYSYMYEPTRKSLCEYVLDLYRQDFTKNWRHFNYLWVNTVARSIFELKEAAKNRTEKLVYNNSKSRETISQSHPDLSNFHGCLLFSVENTEVLLNQDEQDKSDKLMERLCAPDSTINPQVYCFLPECTCPLAIQCQLFWRDTTPKNFKKKNNCELQPWCCERPTVNKIKTQKYTLGSQKLLLC